MSRRALLLVAASLLVLAFRPADVECPIRSILNQTTSSVAWVTNGHIEWIPPGTDYVPVFEGDPQELDITLSPQPNIVVYLIHVEKTGDRIRVAIDGFPGDTSVRTSTWGRLKSLYGGD